MRMILIKKIPAKIKKSKIGYIAYCQTVKMSNFNRKAEIDLKIGDGMEDMIIKHLNEIYGLDPNSPHMALQFPRLPPNLTHPMFQIYNDSVREQFSQQTDSTSQRLSRFRQSYIRHAADLLVMGSGVVPPGHPLDRKDGSITALYSERDRLQRENAELRKKLEKNTKQD